MTLRNTPSPYASLIARTPVRTSWVPLRGGTTRLRRYGPGHADPDVSDDAAPRLLLLHGFRGDHHGLEPIVAHLIGVCPDLEVLVPDLPGFGESAPLPDTRHDVAGYAAWARELLRAVAPRGGIVLGGHSFGSVVAAATLAEASSVDRARDHARDAGDAVVPASATSAGSATASHPPVDRLVLINPIPRPPLSGRDVISVGSTAVLHALAGVLPERAGTWVLRHQVLTRVASLAMVRTRDRGLRRWIHEEHDRYFGGFATRGSLLEAFSASITASVRESAERIEVPTLLIGGADDDLARVGHQRALAARFPDARLRIVPNVGHLTHYETPGEVAREIADFLDVPHRSVASAP